jgi:hypothetical protein
MCLKGFVVSEVNIELEQAVPLAQTKLQKQEKKLIP